MLRRIRIGLWLRAGAICKGGAFTTEVMASGRLLPAASRSFSMTSVTVCTLAVKTCHSPREHECEDAADATKASGAEKG